MTPRRAPRFAKHKGTLMETAVADWLTAELGVDAYRRAGAGSKDKGDIHIPSVPICVECKNTKRLYLPQWEREVAAEVANAGAVYGALLWSPPGVGPKNIHRWVVFEWSGSALPTDAASAALYGGHLNKLVDAMRLWPDYVFYLSADGEVRARFADLWLYDLRELIASTSHLKPSTLNLSSPNQK